MKKTFAFIVLGIFLISFTSAVLYYKQTIPNYGEVLVVDEVSEYKSEVQQIINQEKSSMIPTPQECDFYKQVIQGVFSGQLEQGVPTIQFVELD
jgi:hypothetical protein